MKYYHVWFRTKLKRNVFVGEIDSRLHALFKQISLDNDIELIISGSLPDHAHLLMGLKEMQELSWAAKTFKGISSRKLFMEYNMLKYQLKINNLWARGYGSKEVSLEALPVVTDYIRDQKKNYHEI